jgi:hypothetical protein
MPTAYLVHGDWTNKKHSTAAPSQQQLQPIRTAHGPAAIILLRALDAAPS